MLAFCKFNISRFFFAFSSNMVNVDVRCSGVSVLSFSKPDLSPVLSIIFLAVAAAIVFSKFNFC